MTQSKSSRATMWFAFLSIIVIAGVAAAALTRDYWLQSARNVVFGASASDAKDSGHSHGGAGHSHSHGSSGHSHAADDASHSHGSGGHSHGADGHSHGPANSHSAHSHSATEQANSLELSEDAWKNIGLKTAVVQLQSYVKSVSAPAIVRERPGRTQVNVAAPLTGIVTRVFPIEGEAIEPGQSLFEMRLTHEDLVTAQREFLRSAQELDVIKREIKRLETVGDGVVAGRRVLEQKYLHQKTEAALHAQRQGLLLHGMLGEQIDNILQTRTLLATMTIRAPEFDDDADDHGLQHVYHVQSIPVKRGQSVSAGEPLAVLADHCVLYVEGQAFENDAEHLLHAAKDGLKLTVSAVRGERGDVDQFSLPILYLADHFELDSRAQTFYLRLPNRLIRDEKKGEHRFVTWQFRPGQRMSVSVPMGEGWKEQIVLPPEAVVDEGAESYVFQQAKDHFDRVAVHVLFRDRDAIVIERDDKLVGKRLAVAGAYQMQLAIKNRAGGGAAAHHGHTH